MEITGQQIFDFLSQYGYWIMLPLMIIEGPAATMVAAILARLGAFNIWLVFLLSLLGDVVGDLALYFIGRHWGMSFVRGPGRFIGLSDVFIEKIKSYFEHHGGKIIFSIKSTTGLCWAVFIASGVVKMKLGKFLFYSILGGVVWSGFLAATGYFYGYLWAEISKTIEWVGWAVGILAAVTFISFQLYKKHQSANILPHNGGR